MPPPVPRTPAGADSPVPGLPDGRVVLFVGSLWGFRGVREAARAARHVLESAPDAHAVFVGEDARVDGRASHRVVADETGPALAARVHLTGRLPPPAVAAWMRAADVLLHPGTREAFGLVLLEAAREGLPVVGADGGACAEIVRDGETGLLADPGDPQALAAAVLRVLDDGDLRACLTAAAREALDTRFSLARCVTESVAVLERAAAGG